MDGRGAQADARRHTQRPPWTFWTPRFILLETGVSKLRHAYNPLEVSKVINGFSTQRCRVRGWLQPKKAANISAIHLQDFFVGPTQKLCTS